LVVVTEALAAGPNWRVFLEAELWVGSKGGDVAV
jgi:hypothetical protein